MQDSARIGLPKSILWMGLLSFFLQVAAIGAFRQYRIRTDDDHFGFGWEMGRVGRALALGQGFSNPYGDNTGPTAWEPPLYPYLIGAVFMLFGIYSQASAWVLLSINCLFSALTCIPIFLIARRTFDDRIALWSAWTWALLPYAWYWSIHWVWDTTFTPLLLSLIFLLTLALEESQECKNWALFGVLWGVGALGNPSMLVFLPFCGLWVWRRRWKRGTKSFAGVVLASAVFFVCLAPWIARNYAVFGRFVFLRDDFGFQFRLGNGPGADGMLMAYLQPNLNAKEFDKFRRMGELAYAEDRKREAFEWVLEHPARFVAISVRRFLCYWAGKSRGPWRFLNLLLLAWSVLSVWGLWRAVCQKGRGVWLFAGLVFFYPLVYYFVFSHARYRHPIEPELLILAVFLISEMGKRRAVAKLT